MPAIHKRYKIIIVSVVAILMLRVCLSNDKKKDTTLIRQTVRSVPVTVVPEQKPKAKVNTGVFGINIGFAFHRELDKDSGFVQLLRGLHPHSLRFPGGTVANYYHPELPVYGYKKEELLPSLYPLYNVQSKRSENILYNYIRLCKLTGAGAVYCANVLTGTDREIFFVIDELKRNNIPLLGVELGNEFCLMGYRKEFPDAMVYVKKIKSTALALRERYPNLKIVVIGGDGLPAADKGPKASFMRAWNQVMSKETFFDAYTTHIYEDCAACDQDAYFDNVYLKNIRTLAPQRTKNLYNAGVNLVQIYGKERKLWLTEWNLGNLEYLENTITQGAYVFENFLTLIDLNATFNNYIEISNLHSIDGLISTQQGKLKPLFSVEADHASTQYFAFKFLASTLTPETYRASETISCKDTGVLKNFVCNTFVNPVENKTYLHFVNRSGKRIQLNIQAPEGKSLHITSVEAALPYATAGKTNYEKKYPNKVKPITWRNEDISGKVTIAPYAFGYIAY